MSQRLRHEKKTYQKNLLYTEKTIYLLITEIYQIIRCPMSPTLKINISKIPSLYREKTIYLVVLEIYTVIQSPHAHSINKNIVEYIFNQKNNKCS